MASRYKVVVNHRGGSWANITVTDTDDGPDSRGSRRFYVGWPVGKPPSLVVKTRNDRGLGNDLDYSAIYSAARRWAVANRPKT